MVRIHRDYDISRFATIRRQEFIASDGQTTARTQPFRIADVGAYLVPKLIGDARLECLGWMLGVAAETLNGFGHEFIYGQVKDTEARRYADIGFHSIGDPFDVNGWDYTWTPVVASVKAFLGDDEAGNDAVSFPGPVNERFMSAVAAGRTSG